MTAPTNDSAPKPTTDDLIQTLEEEASILALNDWPVQSVKLRQAAARLRELEAEIADAKRVIDSMRDQRFVDATPDAEMPARILAAYIDDSITVSEPTNLGDLMNKWQAERNAILRKAIAALAAERNGGASSAPSGS